jgi:hypothetical protein
MEKDIHNIDKTNGKTLHYSDTIESDFSQTISDFLKGVQNVSTQQTTTFTSTGDIVGENITAGILNVIQKFTFNGNFIMLENEDFASDTTIPETPNFILLATDNNHGMYLRVPYIYTRGDNTSVGEVSEYDYVPVGQEPAETWLTVTDSKFKVTGPFTQIKSDKVAFRDKILTVGYIDRVEFSGSSFTLGLEDGNNIDSATCRGIDFEYIDDAHGAVIKKGFYGYSFELDRWLFYKDIDYQMDGDLNNEMKISKKSPSNLNKCELDHIYTNKIHASDNTTLDYIEILSNDYIKLYTGGTFTYPTDIENDSLYLNALNNFESYVKNGHLLLNTGTSVPSTIGTGEIYLNARNGLFGRSHGGNVTLNSQDASSIILAGSASITSQLTKSGTTYKSVMSSSGFTFGTSAATWITIDSSSLYSNNSNFTVGTSGSKIGKVYATDIHATNLYAVTLVQELDANNQALTNVKINSGSINGTTVGFTSPSTGAFTTLSASSTLTVTSTTDSTSTITGALIISGGVGIAKNTYIGENLNVSGITSVTDTTDSSSSITGSVILSGGVGIAKKLYVGSTLNVTGATLLNNTLGISGVTSVTNTTQSTSTITGATVISGGLGVAKAVYIGETLNVAGVTSITNTTQSTSTITGATVISGGLGVAKATYLGGILNVAGTTSIVDTTQSTSTITGAAIISGGLGVAKATYLGGTLNVAGVASITDTTQSTSTITGAAIISGGLGVAKAVYIGGTLNVAGAISITDTTQSTSTITGSTIISGGLGVAKATYIGGILNITDTTNSSSTITGSAILSGGLGVVKNTYIGGTLNVVGITSITDTTQSSTTANGSLIVYGGVGIAKNVFIGGTLNSAGVTSITNTTQSTLSTNGALVISGGLGVAKDVFIGGSLTIGATFSAADLNISGTLTVGSNGSASDSIFYSDIAGKNMMWDSTNAKLVITGVNNTTSLNVADGNVLIADNLSVSGTFDVDGATTLDKVTIDTTDGDFSVSGSNQITLSTIANEASAISLTTNGGITETIVIKNTQGTNTSAIALVASAGGITLDSQGVLELNSSAGVISIGNDTNNQNIGLATAGTRILTIGTTTTTIDVNAAGITIDGATLSIDSTDTTNLTMTANDAADKTLTISATNSGLGVGNIAVNSDGNITIDSRTALELNSSAGSISIGNDADNQNINIATAGTRTLTLGTTKTTVDLNAAGITIDGTTLSIDSTDTTNLTLTANDVADKTLTISATNVGTGLGNIDISSDGNTTITSTANSTNSIYLHTNGGTSETIEIHADKGTSTTSVNIVSDAGGITLNALSAVVITNGMTVGGTFDVNGETTLDKVTIDTTDGDFLVSGPNQITLSTTANEASAISLTTNGGTSETIVIKNTKGTNDASINIMSSAGGITLNSLGTVAITNGMTVGGTFDVNGNTTLDKVTIDTTDGDFLVSGPNQITLSTTANEASAISLTTNGGTNETIVIKNTKGTDMSAIELVATAGGITLDSTGVLELNSSAGVISIGNDNINQNINIATAGTRTLTLGTTTTTIDLNAAGITIDGTTLSIDSTDTTNLTMTADNVADKTLTISATNVGTGLGNINISSDGSTTITSTSNQASAIYLRANGGTNETIKIHADQGTAATSVNIISDVGGITLNASGVVTITNGATVGGTFDVNGETTLDKVTIDTTDGDFSVFGPNQIILLTTANEASAISLTTNGGTSETIVIKNTKGTDMSAIELIATAGGVTLDSTGVLELNSSAGVISIGNDNINQNINIATAGTRTLTLGTTSTTIDLNAAGITIDGTTLSIDSTDTTNLTMTADNVADKTLTISATNVGTGLGNIDITSDGKTTITSTANEASAIALITNGGTSETIVITNTKGSDASAIALVATAGGVTIDSAGILELNSSAGVISIGNNNVNQNINVATAGTRTLTLGTTTTTIDLNAAGITIDGTTLSIDSTDTTNLTMTADNVADKTLTISATNTGMGLGNIDITSDGITTITSTSNQASAIYLHTNGGTSETIKIHADQGTNAASIDIMSSAGGITLNALDKVAITNDMTVGGTFDVNGNTTLDKVTIDTTDGDFLVSGPNKITLSTTANKASAISLTTNGGINETIVIKNTQGTTASALTLVATAGGITIDSADTLELNSSAGVISIGNDNVNQNINIATAGTRTLTLGTTTTTVDLNAAGVTIDGTTLSIDSTDTTNLTMTAKDTGSKTLTISATNTGTGSGHIDITADGNTTITSTANNSNAIYIHANGGITESIVLRADQGTSANSIELTSDAGGITLNATSGAGSIALTGITNYYSKIIDTGGTTTTLTNDQSGSIVLISGANDIVTLPTNTLGTTFKLISIIASSGSMKLASTTTDVTFIGTTLLTKAGAAGVVHDSTTVSKSIKLTSKAHDGVIFDCYATGSVWVIQAIGTNSDATSDVSIYTIT